MRSSSGVAHVAVLLASISLLCLTHGASEPNATGLSKYSFPKDFMLGVSTAAFQIEGGWNAGGKGESMWDTYIHKHPEYTPDRSNGDIAADSYHKYMEDIEIIKSLGVKYYRMSISWPRGYGNDYFVPVLLSHGIGDYLCAHYMLLAHSRVYHLYDRKYRPFQKGIIGITLDAFWAEPKDVTKPEDHEAAERYLQIHMGLYAHPIFSKTGDYPDLVRHILNNNSVEQGFARSRLPYFSEKEVNELRGSSDFFGLNHYTTFLMSPSSMEKGWRVPSMDHDAGVKMEQNLTWPKPGADWLTVYPPGFRRLLNWITKSYGKKVPIIVTENGVCDAGHLQDYDRVEYFNKYLDQLLRAVYEDGCNIRGYFAWTLMDDFEWSDGYLTKFGLFSVDFDSPFRTRTPKLSALNYADIVRKRRINFDKYSRPAKLYQADRIR